MRESEIEVLRPFEDMHKRFLDMEENIIFMKLNHFYQNIILSDYTQNSRLR